MNCERRIDPFDRGAGQTKNLPSSKFTICNLFSFDSADPRSMQDACHIWMSCRSSVNGAPARCSGGHEFDSCRVTSRHVTSRHVSIRCVDPVVVDKVICQHCSFNALANWAKHTYQQ